VQVVLWLDAIVNNTCIVGEFLQVVNASGLYQCLEKSRLSLQYAVL
jgi:hypothetical protein